jgi:hypothetical protein
MRIEFSLDIDSIKEAKKKLQEYKTKTLPTLTDALIRASCIWIIDRSNAYLELSGMNRGIIDEIYNGWREPKKLRKNQYLLQNYGRGYSVEFGIGVCGEDTYKGDVPSNYEYNVDSGKKLADGSWIFRVEDIGTLDIMQENVLPNKKGEVNYEEGKTIKTQGQQAIMFVYNAINDFVNDKVAIKIWKQIKERDLV